MSHMPIELNEKVDRFTNLQRAYCRYRAKNLTMAVSAQRAGSAGKDAQSLARVGYQIEQIDGAKDYIEYLKSMRSTISSIDEQDLMTMLKDVYDQSMHDANFREANVSAKLMAQCLGMLGKDTYAASKQIKAEHDKTSGIKENVNVFKEEEEEDYTTTSNQMNDRLAKLQSMMKEVNKSK